MHIINIRDACVVQCDRLVCTCLTYLQTVSKQFCVFFFQKRLPTFTLQLCSNEYHSYFATLQESQASNIPKSVLQDYACFGVCIQNCKVTIKKNSKTRSSLGRFGLFPWCKVATKKCTRAQLPIFHLFPSCKQNQ